MSIDPRKALTLQQFSINLYSWLWMRSEGIELLIGKTTGLRKHSDFVYSNESSFQFVQRLVCWYHNQTGLMIPSSLIRSGAAIPFTAHATSPTITMPRIKALTTGSIPSFLDVILNFAESDTTSTLANQDTWPTQLGAKPSGKVLLYGDDTWLKLFPNVFHRSDGTSSFFVSVGSFH
jgi:ethanolaminephosphotransferase